MHVETAAGEPLVSPCSTAGLINKVGYAPWSLIEYKSYKDSIHDYFLDVSLCLLMNKLLNLEEGEEHGFNEKDSSLIGSCLLKLSSTDGLNNDVVCSIAASSRSDNRVSIGLFIPIVFFGF
ncbi:hypothetical protein Dimus_013394 [Dionaea muscipula]